MRSFKGFFTAFIAYSADLAKFEEIGKGRSVEQLIFSANLITNLIANSIPSEGIISSKKDTQAINTRNSAPAIAIKLAILDKLCSQ